MLKSPPAQLGWLHPVTILATWFWSGLSPKAPGTFGTIAAIPFGIIFLIFGCRLGLVFSAFVIFIIGIWISNLYGKALKEDDPGAIVIDEVAAIWLVMAALPFTPVGVLLAFVLFRFFDIMKPFPIKHLEHRLTGGFGVMVDDMLAAVYAVGTGLIVIEAINRVVV